ncbi:MAG: hypothetical protein IKR92_03355 [Alphaproteobacteria bacterium]|nr:hypothetical protein [Alphaproteobacteria bacterium]
MKYSSGYCPYCKKQVKIEKEEIHYNLIIMILLGIIITFTLGGLFTFLFVIFWISCCILNELCDFCFGGWRCSHCGGNVVNHSVEEK